MNIWEMAQACVAMVSPATRANAGRKPKDYVEMRQEMCDCVGDREARRVLMQAYAARDAKVKGEGK